MASGDGVTTTIATTGYDYYSTENYSSNYDYADSSVVAGTFQNQTCKAITIPKVILMPFLVLLLLLCLFGNLWLLFKLLKKRVKKVSTYLLILMCVNSFCGCLCIIFTIVENYIEFSTAVCKLRMMLFWGYVFFDMFLICWLCFDTWCAVWFQVKRTQHANRNCWFLCTVVLIILAMVLSIQKALHIEAIKQQGQLVSQCQFHSHAHTTLKVFNVAVSINVFGFILPMIFLCIFYGMCLWKLYKAVFKTRQKIIKTMMLFVFMFLLTWGPFYIISFIQGLISAEYISPQCGVKSLLSFLNSLLGLWGMAHGGLQVLIYILCNSNLNTSLFACFKR
nr:membrane protein G74 [Equid gammaherpesvirus 5]UTK45572.1 membrane protein G74 [Equid gammaherpesvirus 5]UTK45651.1 membrane protein G74 [Equid gammaherpesvirus 5]UTK45730.1 membrane protein G74 [Equid gammaherpesvirus 5]